MLEGANYQMIQKFSVSKKLKQVRLLIKVAIHQILLANLSHRMEILAMFHE